MCPARCWPAMSSEMAHFALMKCNEVKHACLAYYNRPSPCTMLPTAMPTHRDHMWTILHTISNKHHIWCPLASWRNHLSQSAWPCSLHYGTMLPIRYSSATRPQMTILPLVCLAERPGSDPIYQSLFLLERIKYPLVTRDSGMLTNTPYPVSSPKLGTMPMSTQQEAIIRAITWASNWAQSHLSTSYCYLQHQCVLLCPTKIGRKAVWWRVSSPRSKSCTHKCIRPVKELIHVPTWPRNLATSEI